MDEQAPNLQTQQFYDALSEMTDEMASETIDLVYNQGWSFRLYEDGEMKLVPPSHEQ